MTASLQKMLCEKCSSARSSQRSPGAYCVWREPTKTPWRRISPTEYENRNGLTRTMLPSQLSLFAFPFEKVLHWRRSLSPLGSLLSMYFAFRQAKRSSNLPFPRIWGVEALVVIVSGASGAYGETGYGYGSNSSVP
eukprot:s933_g6.t1